MEPKGIYRRADALVKRCGTRDALVLAERMGVWVRYEEGFRELLGMYTCLLRHRIVLLNPRLEPRELQLVLAHELGHDQCHRSLVRAAGQMKEFRLFAPADATEYEANAFAAHLLLDSAEVDALAREGRSVDAIAAELGTVPDLLRIKLAEMRRLGWDLPELPHDSRFLRRMAPAGSTRLSL